MKTVVITLAMFCSLSSFADVTCFAVARKTGGVTDNVNDAVTAALNDTCDTTKPFSVSPILNYFRYGFGESGATLPDATQICCAQKH